MTSYYTAINRETTDNTATAYYESTHHAQGAWNDFEQHMAVATGLMAYELERFFSRDDLMIARLSLDILGVIYLGKTIVRTQFIRTGRTIELIETTLSTIDRQGNERISIIMRAWRLATSDTSVIAGTEDQIRTMGNLPSWDGLNTWGGNYIKSLKPKIAHHRAGKSLIWLNTDVTMVENEPVSDFVHLIGMVDIANGIAIRTSTIDWIFPSIDLQIHLHRTPQGRWLGLETIQQIGKTGVGLTSSILHDAQGAFGRAEQILTVRKRPTQNKTHK